MARSSLLVSLVSLVVLPACGSDGTALEHASTIVSSTTEPTVVSTADTSPDDGTTTTSSTTVDCSTLLTVACTGNDVRRLQKLLNSKGFGRSPVDGHLLIVDGVFGDATADAFGRFEKQCSSSCTNDGRIAIDGGEWAFLEALPTTDPEEDSG